MLSCPPFSFTWQPVSKPKEEVTWAEEPTKQDKIAAEIEESTKQVEIDAPSQAEEIVKLKAELASKDEELQLNKKRIDLLTATKESLLSIIENSARKLIPSVIAAKDKVIQELGRELANARLESSVASEKMMIMEKELMSATSDREATVNAKDRETDATIAAVKEEHAKSVAAKEDDILVGKEVLKTTMTNAKSKHASALAALEEKLVAKEEEVASKDESISSLNAKILQLEKDNEAIAVRETEIESLSRRAEERDGEIAARDDEIAGNRACIMSLESDLSDAMGKLEGIDNPIEHLMRYLEVKEKHIALLEVSLGTREEVDGTKEMVKKEDAKKEAVRKDIVKKKAVEEEPVEEEGDASPAVPEPEAEVDTKETAPTKVEAATKANISKVKKQNLPTVYARDDTEEVAANVAASE